MSHDAERAGHVLHCTVGSVRSARTGPERLGAERAARGAEFLWPASDLSQRMTRAQMRAQANMRSRVAQPEPRPPLAQPAHEGRTPPLMREAPLGARSPRANPLARPVARRLLPRRTPPRRAARRALGPRHHLDECTGPEPNAELCLFQRAAELDARWRASRPDAPQHLAEPAAHKGQRLLRVGASLVPVRKVPAVIRQSRRDTM